MNKRKQKHKTRAPVHLHSKSATLIFQTFNTYRPSRKKLLANAIIKKWQISAVIYWPWQYIIIPLALSI